MTDERTLRIDSAIALENEMCRYNCCTLEELREVLWDEYGVTVVINY